MRWACAPLQAVYKCWRGFSPVRTPLSPCTRTHPRAPTARSCATAQHILGALQDRAAGEPEVEAGLRLVGECMRQSHRGYASIGLGCEELDAMLAALEGLGPDAGVYGGRVSGGGSGGTMVVLCREDAVPAVEALAERLTFGKPFTGLIR